MGYLHEGLIEDFFKPIEEEFCVGYTAQIRPKVFDLGIE